MSSNRYQENLLRVIGQMDLTPCDGCDQCGLRCAAGVQMSRQEFDAVREYIDRAPDRDEIDRVEAQDKTVDLGGGVTVQMCRFRDMTGGRCVVYPARPLVCRLLGHVEWMPCPIEKVPRRVRTQDAVELMCSYADLERHTYEEWMERVQSLESRVESKDEVHHDR